MTGNTWFTSDLHLRHEFVAKTRGFDTTFNHDLEIMRNWKRSIRPGDTVWVLGDLCMSKTHVDYALSILKDLPGAKHLVAGNHDPVSPIHVGAHKHLATYLNVFESVQAYAKIKVEGQKVLLSHYPYDDDHTDQARYTQFRLPDEGNWLIHGHTHKKDQFVHGKQIHVGLDAHGLVPVQLGEIAGIIREAL